MTINKNSLTFRLLMFVFILALLTGGSVYVRVADGRTTQQTDQMSLSSSDRDQTEAIESPSRADTSMVEQIAFH
jgi:hypothetical protein